jgi:hypothetical protein
MNKIKVDLAEIAQVFDINDQTTCQQLTDWLDASIVLNDLEQRIFDITYKNIVDLGDSWNEEELRVRLIGNLFLIADIEHLNKVRLFYERPLAAVVNGYDLSVICDCLVASARLKAPVAPYFFLQALKKAKGEKKDPEAQMLIAMLIAQHLNNDNKPIYGSYLLGTSWRFTTLVGNDYCVSRKFEAANENDFLKIVAILRKLKTLIINR